MLVPELFADVGEFYPGVDQDRAFVAGLNQLTEVLVATGVAVVIVPGGDVDGSDAGAPPAFGEVVGVDAQPVGGIEEGPEATAAIGGLEAEVGEGLESIGESFVARFTGGDGEPEHRPGTAPDAGHEGGVRPAFASIDCRVGRHFVLRQVDRFFPDDGELRIGAVDDALRGDALGGGPDAQGFGEGAFAFDDDQCAGLNAREPSSRGGGGSAGEDDEAGGAVGRGRHSDRAENGGPGGGFVPDDVEGVLKRGATGFEREAGEQKISE